MRDVSAQLSVHGLPLFSSTVQRSELRFLLAGVGCGCVNVWRLDVGLLALSGESCLCTQINLLQLRTLCHVLLSSHTFFSGFQHLILSCSTCPSIIHRSDRRSAAFCYKRHRYLHAPSSIWTWKWNKLPVQYRRQRLMDQAFLHRRRLSVARSLAAVSFLEYSAPWFLNIVPFLSLQKCRANSSYRSRNV